MNTVNRLLVIAELLVAIALMPILITIFLFFRGALVDLFDGITRGLLGGSSVLYSQAVCVGLAAFIFIVAILLLFLELHRPAPHGLRVQQVSDGQVDVTADAIIQRLEHEILALAEVTRVRPHAVPASKGVVDLFLELETTPDVNVPQKTQEVIAVARKVMEERMGLKLGKVQVQVDHARKQKKGPHETSGSAPVKQVDA